MRRKVLMLVVLLAMLPMAPPSWGQTLAQFQQMKLHEMTNVQLDAYLGLMSRVEAPIGEKVVQFASQYVGADYGGAVAIADDLSSVSTTTLGMRALAMAYARNWSEYYAWQTRIRYRSFVPREAETAHWYPVDLAETASWALGNISGDFPDTETVSYTYEDWVGYQQYLVKKYKLDLEVSAEDRTMEKTFAKYTPANVRLLRSGDLVFFMVRRGQNFFKDVEVGVVINQGGALKLVTGGPITGTKVIGIHDFPETKATISPGHSVLGLIDRVDGEIEWLIVYRPKELSRAVLDEGLATFRQTTPMIPTAELADGLKNGSIKRRNRWFNVPGSFKWFSRPPQDDVPASLLSVSSLQIDPPRLVKPLAARLVGTDSSPVYLSFEVYLADGAQEFAGGLKGDKESALIGISQSSTNAWRSDRFQVTSGAEVLTGAEPDKWPASPLRSGWNKLGIRVTSTLYCFYGNGRLIQAINRKEMAGFDQLVFSANQPLSVGQIVIKGKQ